jgi:RHS repeat-associated protein
VAATFGRDGRNRDVKRTINGTTTYLIYDGWNLVAEHDAAGVLVTRYIHGPQVDEILAKVTTASTTFPLPDALGSTIAVTDASGAVMERVYYSDAFGTPTFKDASGTTVSGTTTGTRFLFTGREWLAALSLYDYRNRTYSAEFGRFIETDPIRFDAGDENLYRYVKNQASVLRDPSGLIIPVLPVALIGAAAVAAEAYARANACVNLSNGEETYINTPVSLLAGLSGVLSAGASIEAGGDAVIFRIKVSVDECGKCHTSLVSFSFSEGHNLNTPS